MNILFAIYMAAITGFSTFNVFTHIDKNWEQKGAWQSTFRLNLAGSMAGLNGGVALDIGSINNFGSVTSNFFIEQSTFFPLFQRKLFIGPTTSLMNMSVSGLQETLSSVTPANQFFSSPDSSVESISLNASTLTQYYIGVASRFGIRGQADNGMYLFGSVGLTQDSYSASVKLKNVAASASMTVPTLLGLGWNLGIGVASVLNRNGGVSGDVFVGVAGRGHPFKASLIARNEDGQKFLDAFTPMLTGYAGLGFTF